MFSTLPDGVLRIRPTLFRLGIALVILNLLSLWTFGVTNVLSLITGALVAYAFSSIPKLQVHVAAYLLVTAAAGRWCDVFNCLKPLLVVSDIVALLQIAAYIGVVCVYLPICGWMENAGHRCSRLVIFLTIANSFGGILSAVLNFALLTATLRLYNAVLREVSAPRGLPLVTRQEAIQATGSLS